MKLIDKIRKSTDEVVTAMKWPFRYKMIQRAFDSVTDALAVEKDRMDSKILDLQVKLTKVESEEEARSLVKKIVEAQLDYEAIEASARIAKERKDALEAPVSDED